MSLVGVLLSGVDLGAEGVVTRFLMWTGVVAAYGAFWFALAVGVNALGKSSAANALALAGMWLGFVLVIPSLLNVVVKTIHPVPSRVDMIQAMRVASDDVTQQRSKLMAKYLEDHPELVGASQDSMADAIRAE
jgi:ABC-2 type transport system permease protein